MNVYTKVQFNIASSGYSGPILLEYIQDEVWLNRYFPLRGHLRDHTALGFGCAFVWHRWRCRSGSSGARKSRENQKRKVLQILLFPLRILLFVLRKWLSELHILLFVFTFCFYFLTIYLPIIFIVSFYLLGVNFLNFFFSVISG